MDANTNTSRRSGPDRRRRNVKGSLKGLFLARRRGRRRLADAHLCVDHFRARHLLWAFGIPLLSAIDIFWTLHILAAGGAEVNPLMRSLIEYDVAVFAGLKMALTAACVLFLLVYEHVALLRRVRVETVMYVLLFGYLALFTYELHLISLINQSPG